MVLADTSVWIDHFRRGDPILQQFLEELEVVVHPFILGELACGNFKNRKEIFTLLSVVTSLEKVSDEEYFIFLEKNRLFGTGIGFVDVHLLAAARLAQCSIYTKDKALLSAAGRLDIKII